jgi:hypothetical protein
MAGAGWVQPTVYDEEKKEEKITSLFEQVTR